MIIIINHPVNLPAVVQATLREHNTTFIRPSEVDYAAIANNPTLYEELVSHAVFHILDALKDNAPVSGGSDLITIPVNTFAGSSKEGDNADEKPLFHQ